jgi:hypothetical protein
MNDLCPACLAVLPDGYQSDHVAIDLALAGNTAVLKRMPRPERRDLVTWGRRQGMTDSEIAARVHRSVGEIRNWFTDPVPAYRAHIDDDAVHQLWQEGLSDRQIAERLGAGHNAVLLSRRRQHLPALFTSGGIRKVVAA